MKKGTKRKILFIFLGIFFLLGIIAFTLAKTGVFVKQSNKLKKGYAKFARIAEISAIAAAVQNMILMADTLGIKSCWLGAPLFCRNAIDNLLNQETQQGKYPSKDSAGNP